MSAPENIILADKPKGISSAAMVARVKRAFGAKKAGHAGTLDPLASGLLVIGVNEGTKKLPEFIGLDKTYETEVLFGEKRSTGDMEGKVLETADASRLTEDALRAALDDFVGSFVLPVPLYSATKVGGTPLYKKARRGEATVQPKREMEIRSAELAGFEAGAKAIANVRWRVGSGTYIRSLSEELGRRLGLPATTYSLRRTKVGDFDIADAEEIPKNI